MYVLPIRVERALNEQEIKPVVLLEVEFSAVNGGALRVTDHIHDVTFESQTYSANSPFVGADIPRSEGPVSKNDITIFVDDPTFIYRNRFEVQPAAVPVRLMVLLNQNNTLIDSAISIFKGFTNYPEFHFNDDNQHIAQIHCVGQFRKLSQISPRVTSEDNQKQYHPTDTCFDYAIETVNQTALKWGDKNKARSAAEAAGRELYTEFINSRGND